MEMLNQYKKIRRDTPWEKVCHNSAPILLLLFLFLFLFLLPCVVSWFMFAYVCLCCLFLWCYYVILKVMNRFLQAYLEICW